MQFLTEWSCFYTMNAAYAAAGTPAGRSVNSINSSVVIFWYIPNNGQRHFAESSGRFCLSSVRSVAPLHVSKLSRSGSGEIGGAI